MSEWDQLVQKHFVEVKELPQNSSKKEHVFIMNKNDYLKFVDTLKVELISNLTHRKDTQALYNLEMNVQFCKNDPMKVHCIISYHIEEKSLNNK